MRKCKYPSSCVLFIALLSIFLLFSSVLCQKQETKNTRELLIWQQRVDELTNGIFNDSKSVDDSERTFYLALDS